jgi:hypothetical protein
MRVRLATLLLLCGALVVACGSRSRLTEQVGSGGSPSGGAAGTGAVSGSGGAGGGVGGFGGFGGSPGGAGGSAGCPPVDTGAPCGTLSETACLSAFPRCAPVYDDACCPMCDPTGACADCVDYRFRVCVDRELSSCVPGAIGPCGVTPGWACTGGKADCSHPQCTMTPGCMEALPQDCPEDAFCPNECRPVSAESCGPVCGDPPPMLPCPPGFVHLVENGKYSGLCVESSVCSPPLNTCPPSLPSGSCGSPGQVCTYGSWCKNTCTCDNGSWSCVTPPC